MSENGITSNSFFGNPDIPMNVKVGAIALTMKGTYGIFTTKNGEKVFVSQVYKKGDFNITPYQFTFGDKNSLTDMACLAALKSMGADKISGQNLEVLFNGTMSDEEIMLKIANYNKDAFNMNNTGIKESYTGQAGIRENFEKFFDEYRNNDRMPLTQKYCQIFLQVQIEHLNKFIMKKKTN